MRSFLQSQFSQYALQGSLSLTTADILLAVSVYVVFRRKHPDKATVRRALMELQDNNIDVRLLVEWLSEPCQEENRTEKGCSS